MDARRRTDTDLVARTILNRALTACARNLSLEGPEDAAHKVRQGESASRLHLCHELARQVAEMLGELDERVRAVYAPEGEAANGHLYGEVPNGAPVHLLVWRRERTAAFSILVEALNSALLRACREAIGLEGLPDLLDIQVIDDAICDKYFGTRRRARAYVRPAAAWLRQGQAVDVVYARGAAPG